MCITIGVTFGSKFIERLNYYEHQLAVIFFDPNSFLSGALAGGIARTIVLPVDAEGGAGRVVYRRAPVFGLLFWVYTPLHGDTIQSCAMTGAFAGAMSRILSNPINAARDLAEANGISWMEAANALRKRGAVSLWAGQPPIVANALYHGVLFGTFAAVRPFFLNESSRIPLDPVLGAAITGAASAAVASVLTYPISSQSYNSCLTRPHVFQSGLFKAIAKEVPMTAVAFGGFVAFQKVFNRNRYGRNGGL